MNHSHLYRSGCPVCTPALCPLCHGKVRHAARCPNGADAAFLEWVPIPLSRRFFREGQSWSLRRGGVKLGHIILRRSSGSWEASEGTWHSAGHGTLRLAARALLARVGDGGCSRAVPPVQ